MEVPRLLVDAGLVVISTAAIFVIRKFFLKIRELETSIKQLNETVNKLRSDEEIHSNERKVLDDRYEQVTGHLETQRELLIEVGHSLTNTEETLQTLVSSNEDSREDTCDKYQKILRCHEQLNCYFSNVDEDLTLKVNQVDTTLGNIIARWDQQLEPHIKTTDKAHRHNQECFVEVKESFQELADNICRELTVSNQRLAATAEAIAEHRDHYARDRRYLGPNYQRPYGRDTRSQRGLLRQASYETRCGSHGHEVRPQRRDCGQVRQEPSKRPLVDVIFDDEDEYQ